MVTTFADMKYVAYLRVSTKQQGESGLGLEAQQSIVNHYYSPEVTFIEVKSGSNIKARPELAKAIKYCLENNATLVVAKLDRLSRVVEDCLAIWKKLDGRIRFCDIPGTPDKFTITMYAAFAERERELISLRTKQALQAKKASGWKSDHKRFNVGQLRLGGRERAKVDYSVNYTIWDMRKNGLSFRLIADNLNANSQLNGRGRKWNESAIRRICVKHHA